MPPAGSITGAACTALGSDVDGSYLYTADARGYITMWSMSEFIENLESSQAKPEEFESNKSKIEMLVCWKAHNNKIVDLIHVNNNNKCLISISID